MISGPHDVLMIGRGPRGEEGRRGSKVPSGWKVGLEDLR